MVAQAFDVANTLTRRMGKGINTTVDEGQTPVLSLDLAHALRAEGFDASEDGAGRGAPLVPEIASTITAGQNSAGGNRYPGMTGESAGGQLIPLAFNARQDPDSWVDRTGPIDAMSPQAQAVVTGMRVRRLTPRECERLQGVADDYTLIQYRGKPAADGPRYKSLGNSMARDVIEWIGRRIDAAMVVA